MLILQNDACLFKTIDTERVIAQFSIFRLFGTLTLSTMEKRENFLQYC